MKYARRAITFKVIIGYIILASLATVSGFLIFHEIKNVYKFTERRYYR